ncbi:MAG TPA: UvrD-helicase domain-containing protein [Thermoanaerobaculia bacterium]|nr:UvrD-helicase domain-containing protein [Thermoanaerobaculia bacterium]HUM30751.1 UvrD-helicase domain-containing protein [Thermoanaerobaculia bacterium]HXK68960.1 UvrD-helicase domain-containing protein [Thermoanaerobaculia bacterium]
MSVLRPAGTLSFPHIQKLEASAGSGKTHALTARYLQFLLSDSVPSRGLSQLLAITFTNRAASEMKGRILEWLKKLILSDKAVTEEMVKLTGVQPDVLSLRAGEFLSAIFRNYQDFSVRTIDSFFTGLAHGASLELGLPPWAAIELDARPFLIFALSEFLEQSGGNEPEDRLLREVVNFLFTTRNDIRWDVHEELLENLILFRGLESASGLPVWADPSTQERLFRRLGLFRSAARRILELAEEQDVRFQRHEAIVDKLRILSESSTLQPYFESKFFSRELSDAVLIRCRDSITEPMVRNWERLQRLAASILRLQAETAFVPALSLKQKVEDLVDKKLTRDGAFLLDRLGGRLRRCLLSEGAVPTIYFYWGDRIAHYLIDEFQDTSQSQWDGMAPLVENTLAQQGSLFFVGDKKQAIYRFRGGSAELFDEIVPSLSHATLYENRLPTNWRSRGEIVSYINGIFRMENLEPWFHGEPIARLSLPDTTLDRIGKVYAGASQEWNEPGGYVHVEKPEPSGELSSDDLKVWLMEKILHDHLPAILARHPPRDIAILVRKNREVEMISSMLLKESIPVASARTLQVTASQVVKEILAFMAFLDSPLDDLAFLAFLTGEAFTRISGLCTSDLFSLFHERDRREKQPLYTLFRSTHSDSWDAWIRPFFSAVGHLPPYDLLQEMISVYGLENRFPDQRGFLLHLLELLMDLEGKGINGIGEILTFIKDEANASALQVPLLEDSDAVKVLSLHAAKGLGFPVVILPFPYMVKENPAYGVERRSDRVRLFRLGKNADRSPFLQKIQLEEKGKGLLDEINAFYVSMTRAKDELYLFLPRFGNRSWAGKIPVPVDLEPGEARKIGAPVPGGEMKTVPPTPSLHVPRIRPWQEKLHRRGLSFQGSRGRAQQRAMHRGDQVHLVLSRVKEIDTDLDRLFDELSIPEGDRGDIRILLENLFSHPGIREFFQRSQKSEIYSEYALLNRDGEVFVLDRLIRESGASTILDWKTGEGPTELQVQQVKQYMKLVMDLHPEDEVRGFLIFVDRPEWHEVTVP